MNIKLLSFGSKCTESTCVRSPSCVLCTVLNSSKIKETKKYQIKFNKDVCL